LTVADSGRQWPARDQCATNPQHIAHGPYGSADDAMADARHVYEASRRENRRGTMDRINAGLLLGALHASGVEFGAHDQRIAAWLAGWEPETVQVVIGWIERANRA